MTSVSVMTERVSVIGPKILVVDDKEENLALVQATLEDEGYTVIVANNGQDGMVAFETEQPDCILLDVRMPGMDGIEVCTRLRATSSGAQTPIVFLTALRDVDTFDNALRAGADDFLTKPVRPTELVVRVQAALKLRRMGTELREHYELVRQQRDDLMRLQLQKERLTAFVVHDLKNPISAMDLHAQVLLTDAALSPLARESVRHIRHEARALLRLVLNLLDISKSESGEFALMQTQVDLEKIVIAAFEELSLKAHLSSLKLVHRLQSKMICGDADLLRRVLENLIENAIRHAPPRSEICVATRLWEEGPSRAVELRVSDAGKGIAAEIKNKIFEPFFQAESGHAVVTRTGRGLGLTFCKLVVEAHGGQIWVEDAQPGAVFCIRIPQ